MNVQDTVSIVTGSSSGVGAAMAKMLVVKGGKVVINFSRSIDAAKKVVEECESLGRSAALPGRCQQG